MPVLLGYLKLLKHIAGQVDIYSRRLLVPSDVPEHQHRQGFGQGQGHANLVVVLVGFVRAYGTQPKGEIA